MNFKGILLLGLVIFLCACKTQKLEKVKLLSPEEQFAQIEIKPGDQAIEIKFPDGKIWKFMVHFPENPTKYLPLVIGLHWAGGENTYYEYHDCLLKPGLKNMESILISPQDEQQTWETTYNEEKVLTLIQYATAYWKIDTDAILVTGYSNGGNGAWYFAQNHADVFRAAIPMAGAFIPSKKIDIPLFVIHGDQDELFPVKNTVKSVEMAKEMGTEVVYERAPNKSHFMACDYVLHLRKAVYWFKKNLDPFK